MTAERHSRWGYYRCSRRSNRRDDCPSKYCSADKAHAALQRICLQIRLDRDTAEAIMKAAERLIQEREDRAATRTVERTTKRTQLLRDEMHLTEAFTAGDLSPEAYAAGTTRLRTARRALDVEDARPDVNPAQLAAAVVQTLQLATSLWDLYEQLTEERRAELLRSVFATVVLDREGIAGFTLKAPFNALVTPPDDPLAVEGMATAILDHA
jgi:hypothetical protein